MGLLFVRGFGDSAFLLCICTQASSCEALLLFKKGSTKHVISYTYTHQVCWHFSFLRKKNFRILPCPWRRRRHHVRSLRPKTFAKVQTTTTPCTRQCHNGSKGKGQGHKGVNVKVHDPKKYKKQTWAPYLLCVKAMLQFTDRCTCKDKQIDRQN